MINTLFTIQLSPVSVTKSYTICCRGLQENLYLNKVVEATRELEKAIASDSGVDIGEGQFIQQCQHLHLMVLC